MSIYIYDRPEWPQFQWHTDKIATLLAQVRHQQGRLLGHMEALGFALKTEALWDTLTDDVLKTSEIEGELLDKEQVRSSVARHLGLEAGGLPASDRHIDGMVSVMMDATQQYQKALTKTRLFTWHKAMFPTQMSGLRRIEVGRWRQDSNGPMQVISGPFGKEKVHYQAPPAAHIHHEMQAFLDWFNTGYEQQGIDPVIKAALAHLWFITLHPFEDGNGRLARAITDMALACSETSPLRFYSMSSQIRKQRKGYYTLLENTQRGGLDITPWLVWFLTCLSQALNQAETTLATVKAKAQFWEKAKPVPRNGRQHKLLNQLLDGFEGHLTSGKWAKIAGCSQDTAHRDIMALVDAGLLAQNPGGGRSTSYHMVLP